MELQRECQYYHGLCDLLGGQLLRSRAENGRLRAALRRARTSATVIRQVSHLEQASRSPEALARVLLEAASRSLPVDAAALFQVDPETGDLRPLHAVGFEPARDPEPLRLEEVPREFAHANSGTERTPFTGRIRRLTGAPYFLWSFHREEGLALLLANLGEDHQLRLRFEPEDREIVEPTLDVFANLLERSRIEERLLHAATHDALTGLPNRPLFLEHLEAALRRAESEPEFRFAVLFLDIDRFKVVNDSLGHDAGDELLRAVSRRLRGAVGAADVVARLAGDEFAVLIRDPEELEVGAETVAARIHAQLRVPFPIASQKVFASASVGIARGMGRRLRAEELLREADIAMYEAKQEGGGGHRSYDVQMHVALSSRLLLETELRDSLERQELSLAYQPIVDLFRGNVIGFEALLRWDHPTRGPIAPEEFIPLAEETGLIVPMGRWVLETATRDLAAWQETGRFAQRLFMSINISDREFLEPDVLGRVETALERSGLAPSSLVLELTERMLMNQAMPQQETMRRLRERSVKLAIDDFGTGYSSLSRLQRLPIDRLKIDRSFVRGMDRDRDKAEMVRTIVDMAHNLGMQCIAEGVETGAEGALLRRLGCEYAQGYLFGPPVPASAISLDLACA